MIGFEAVLQMFLAKFQRLPGLINGRFSMINGEFLLLCLLWEEAVGNAQGRGVDAMNAVVK